MDPANRVIEICGGFESVAEMVGRDATRVRRWTYPKERGGTDGLIPAECAIRLMAEAKKAGIPLRAEHFFPDENEEDAA